MAQGYVHSGLSQKFLSLTVSPFYRQETSLLCLGAAVSFTFSFSYLITTCLQTQGEKSHTQGQNLDCSWAATIVQVLFAKYCFLVSSEVRGASGPALANRTGREELWHGSGTFSSCVCMCRPVVNIRCLSQSPSISLFEVVFFH